MVEAWATYRTTSADDWPARRLLRVKGDSRVSVVLPARNEEATVGAIVSTVREHLMDRLPLVDELIVVDSRSTDRTAQVARAAGAEVVSQDAMTRGLPRAAPARATRSGPASPPPRVTWSPSSTPTCASSGRTSSPG